jgi:hypothetical protein
MKWLFDLLSVGIRVQFDIKVGLDHSEPVEMYTQSCNFCEWTSKPFDNPESARRALRAHYQHCTARAQAMEWIPPAPHNESRSNGRE